jgi:small-conductance mechanosensitive channel
LDFAHRWLSNEYALVGEKLYQALRFEHPQGFAERGAAYANQLANLGLNNALAADQHAFADHFAYLRGDIAVQSANIDWLQHQVSSILDMSADGVQTDAKLYTLYKIPYRTLLAEVNNNY